MDEKKLRGEKTHKITQNEINAWKRGAKDAAKSKKMSSVEIPVGMIIKVLKSYAQLGDINYITTKFSVTIEQVKKVLAAFNIQSIEDARDIIDNGVVAELEAAQAQNSDERESAARARHQEAEKRFDELNKSKEQDKKDQLTKDKELEAARDRAQEMNNADRLRQMIADGVRRDGTTRDFQIPLNLVNDFKRLVPHGISQLRRRFGGTRADIVNEVKRLMPDMDVGMLRP